MTDGGVDRPAADGLLDVADQRVLDLLAAAWRHHDPVPDRLVDAVAFAVGRHEVAVEVAAILGSARPVVATSRTRSGDDVRTLTFTTSRTTIMVQVTRTGSGRRRLDGWVEPIDAGSVRLQVGGGTVDADVSDAGRFHFVDLPPATMRLVLLDDEGLPMTVTPAFEW